MRSKQKNLEIIKEFKEKGFVFPITDDIVFKSVIQDENLKDYTAFLINNITGRDIKPDDIVFVNTEIPKENVSDKLNYHDTLLDINNNKISLEMNNSNDPDLLQRNKYHFHSGIYKTINLSYNIGEEKYFEQLNFNNVNSIGKVISKYKLIDIETGDEDKDERNYSKYRINLVKIRNMYYNESRKLTRFEKALLIMTLSNKKELRKVSKGDEMLMKVVKKVESLTEDPTNPHYWDSYFDTEKAMEFGRKMAIKEALEKNTKEVSKQKDIETAKKMLKETSDISFISRITDLKEEEIKKLKQD